MKQYILNLSSSKVSLVFIGIMLFGITLSRIQDITFILAGFGILIFGLHESGHLLALKNRHYNVVGITISIWPPGIGPRPERPIDPNDTTLVYLSGLLISLIVPFYVMLYTLEAAAWFLAAAILLSVVDIWNWWQLKREKTKES